MEKKDILNENKNLDNFEDKEINIPIVKENEDKNLSDSNSYENQIITELEKLYKKDNNDIQKNTLSKSLSDLNRINSEKDKKTISNNSYLDSNIVFNYPNSKKLIVDVNKLSQRVSKVEYENESKNRMVTKELRSKYFPNKKIKFQNNTFIHFNETKKVINPTNNIRLKSMNPNRNNNLEIIYKNNMISNSVTPNNNNIINYQNIINKENNNYKNLPKKNNFFMNLLKEDNNYINKIKPITKAELSKYSNEKEKIIALLEKNRELVDILRKIDEKYKILKNEFIELYKNSNNFGKSDDLNKDNNENEQYKKYLIDENKNLKIKVDNYNKIFQPMINYINDLNKVMNLKKINSIELKNSINILDSSNNNVDDKNNPLNIFLHTLNENLNNIYKSKNHDNDYRRSINKISNKMSYGDDEDILKIMLLTDRKDKKNKMKNYYDKL
jgi:hypothetical protein